MDHVITLAPPVAGDGTEDSLLFVGNATMLIRVNGFTVLTDPTFVHRHESVPLGYGPHTTRLTDPAIEFDDLPPIDFVLLSHLHGDHLDRVAQERLPRSVPILTTRQSALRLRELGFGGAVGLDTWDRVTLTKGAGRLRVTACPGRHGPGVSDLVLPDVMGSVIEFGGADARRRMYISGDTLLVDDLAEIPRRYPRLDVGVFHLGGTRVMGLLVTMDADQGIQAVQLIDAGTSIPVHYDDYDVFTSSLEDFLEAAADVGLRERVHPLGRGDRFSLAAPPGAEPDAR
ncbi:MAG TPA: MBL fold metallo-hydrolase [Ornithinibacter sp.]|nr:MBL fold metallo-hydrolase [Ornithinibacter sp.]